MEEFTNNYINIEDLPVYENVPLNSLHPDYWKIIVINISIFLIFFAVAIGGIILLKDSLRTNIIIITILFLVLGAGLFVAFRFSFLKRGFALRDKDIIYRSGILSTTTIIIPFNRIQHVSLNEGWISRIYNLGRIDVFTAGGASGSLKIPGLEIENAQTIKELLLKKVSHANT